MIKHILTVLFFSFCYMQSGIDGYAIFDYSNASGDDGFALNRAYINYSTDVSEELFFKIRLDAKKPTGLRSVFVKNLYVDWKCENGDKLSMGLIGTNSYGVQEKNWGYRFIEKSVVDKYGMTNTADLGIGYSRSSGKIKSSIQLLNGEGSNDQEYDYNQALYLSILYGESRLDKNDGMNFGIVLNHSPQNDETDNDLIGLFGGWAFNGVGLGIEYNIYETNFTEKATAIYANYGISDSWDVFLRYDVNDLNVDDDDEATDLTIIGGVWNPTQGLFISPNVYLEEDINTYRFTFMFKY